jgi:putative transposase
MGKRKKPEEIKRLLQEAERDMAKGLSVADVCRKTGVSEATFHRWRQRFSASGAADAGEARRVKQLESEVSRLKELVAELMLDKRMLQDVAKIKW